MILNEVDPVTGEEVNKKECPWCGGLENVDDFQTLAVDPYLDMRTAIQNWKGHLIDVLPEAHRAIETFEAEFHVTQDTVFTNPDDAERFVERAIRSSEYEVTLEDVWNVMADFQDKINVKNKGSISMCGNCAKSIVSEKHDV